MVRKNGVSAVAPLLLLLVLELWTAAAVRACDLRALLSPRAHGLLPPGRLVTTLSAAISLVGRGLGATGGRPQQRPPAVGFKARTKAAFWSIVMWYARGGAACCSRHFLQRLLKLHSCRTAACSSSWQQAHTDPWALLLSMQGQQQGAEAAVFLPLSDLW